MKRFPITNLSVPAKGKIKKIVRFTEIDKNIHNLAFGDLHDPTGELNDIIVTNNNGSDVVLATVAKVVYDFTTKKNNSVVIAQGSTHSRTRLYRMGISKHLSIIRLDFDIFGLYNEEWEPFVSRRDYEAFLVYRK